MAIDPDLYQKYSGRSGDPYERMGEALAQNAGRKAQRDALKGQTRVPLFLGIKGLLIHWLIERFGIVGVLIVVVLVVGGVWLVMT